MTVTRYFTYMENRKIQAAGCSVLKYREDIEMEQYKADFIDFMVESDVLKFGEFTLKSGRKSPFFMNAGAYVTGYQLKKLGEYYAKAIHAKYGAFRSVLLQRALTMIGRVKRFVTVLTVRKPKIMAQIKAVFSEAR